MVVAAAAVAVDNVAVLDVAAAAAAAVVVAVAVVAVAAVVVAVVDVAVVDVAAAAVVAAVVDVVAAYSLPNHLIIYCHFPYHPRLHVLQGKMLLDWVHMPIPKKHLVVDTLVIEGFDTLVVEGSDTLVVEGFDTLVARTRGMRSGDDKMQHLAATTCCRTNTCCRTVHTHSIEDTPVENQDMVPGHMPAG